MAFTDDVFSSDPEKVTASIILPDDSTITVDGIFRDATDGATQYGVEIEAMKPTFECATSAIADVKKNNRVTIGTDVWTANKISHVGTGISVIFLKTYG